MISQRFDIHYLRHLNWMVSEPFGGDRSSLAEHSKLSQTEQYNELLQKLVLSQDGMASLSLATLHKILTGEL